MIIKKEVQHIAKLARIGITKEEEEKFTKDLSSILDYFKSLQEIDVSKVEPIFHSTEIFSKKNPETMREDREMLPTDELTEKLIQTAPDKEKKYIKTKAIF